MSSMDIKLTEPFTRVIHEGICKVLAEMTPEQREKALALFPYLVTDASFDAAVCPEKFEKKAKDIIRKLEEKKEGK